MSDELVAEYAQSAELALAVEAAERPGAAIGGLWGGSPAFFVSSWALGSRGQRAPGAFIVITASQEESEDLLEEFATFAPGAVLAFPAWESLFLAESTPDPEICGARLAVLDALARPRTDDVFVVAPVQALIQPAPDPAELGGARIVLQRGQEVSPPALAETLARRGYRAVPLVELPGEFSWRGDILDVYAWVSRYPLRLELFGDTVESARFFEPSTQRSIAASDHDQVELLLPSLAEVFRDCFRGSERLFFDYLRPEDRLLQWEPVAIADRAERVFHNTLGGSPEDASREVDVITSFSDRLHGATQARLTALPVAPDEANGFNARFGTVEQLRGSEIAQVLASLHVRLESGSRVRVYCENEGEATRFLELLEEHGLGREDRIEIVVGGLRRGFQIETSSRVVVTSRELFNRHVVRRSRRRAVSAAKAIQSFLELERGDYVVHVSYGIGRFLGIECLERDSVEQEFLTLEFRDGVRVYVPVSKIDLVQKYIGSGDRVPVLDKVGGTSWAKKKESVETALLDLAAEMLDIQASRQERPGIAAPPDSEWQRAFEAAFPFEDTPDQADVTEAIKTDMIAARPMDRLICGDVGYGKTELAMRAAFKAVEGGRQVAVLVPTTLLAEQHYRTFRERMAEFPVTIDALSRFRTPKEQREIVARGESGGVDILIGTHRILSEDVRFRDLGLVIIDEEQRFGVAHKERFKRLRSQVDVLTLSATPIPRTLHMALLGIRDISSLTTAPLGRTAIHTEICHFDRKKLREIIVRELNRDGQVYFVHNRVKDIEIVQREIEQIVPEARLIVAHGQMNEHELEERMVAFMERRGDILLATTIIESGIDIQTVNTIVINDADRYGMADLHQLRGRVGRYKHQAYCYLLLPDHRHVNEDGRKRMRALVEFSGLGSGFQIAMRDLEIRGAGNILGKEQSGHIATVGYDLYCRLLAKCVRTLRDEDYHEPVTVEVDLALDAFIPDAFVGDEGAKIELYRRVSIVASRDELPDLRAELEDRFGKLPRPFRRLLELQEFRLLCSEHGVESIGRQDDTLVLRGGEAMSALLATCPLRVVVLDARTVAIPLVADRKTFPPELDDRRLFELLSRWLRTGEFPGSRPRRGHFVDISGGRGRVALDSRPDPRGGA